jgi:hypothetical protein
MSSISNIYSEKIFAQHPIATWSLDDSVDYISLITDATRNLSTGWTISTTDTATSYTPSSSAPFASSATTKLLSGAGNGSITATSSATFTTTSSSFCIGFYLYVNTLNITSVQIGYDIGGTKTYSSTQYYPSVYQNWTFISNTFFTNVTNAKIVIKINYSGTATNNEFWINGLTVGHMSEEFNKYSLGIQPSTLTTLSSITGFTSQKGYETKDYGNSQYSAYYLANSEKMFANSSKTPIVMGSDKTVSFAYETSGSSYQPSSMIFPAFGFLNKYGRYKEYTLEFWMKLNYQKWTPPDTDGITKTKILGLAIEKTGNGLYVSNNSLILQLGDKFGAHYVGYWNRPMLLHITYNQNFIKLFVNGEEAISLTLESSDLDTLYSATSETDWLGIGSESQQIQIDSWSIYPYQFSNIQSTLNFVAGSATKTPEEINSQYDSSTVIVDYPKANYSNNYNYPDTGKWKHGLLNNFVEKNNALSSPTYSLPSFIFVNSNNLSKDTLESANSALPPTANEFTLKPTSSYDKTYIKFNSLNILNETVKGFHTILKAASSGTEKMIFKFVNKNTNNYLKITTQNNNIYYKYSNDAGINETTISTSTTITRDANNLFFVGMDIDKFTTNYPNANLMNMLFSNPDDLLVYFGGDNNTANNYFYEGSVVRISFDNKRNLKNFSTQINTDGTFISNPGATSWLSKYDSLSSYTLMFNTTLGFDIGTSCYWQDYIPLNLLGTYVLDGSSNKVYDLDFIQYNVDYTKLAISTGTSFLYSINDGIGLNNYITFQDIESSTGPNLDLSAFATTVSLNSNNTIVPSSGTGWTTTKYEVNDRTIIYLPESMGSNFTKYAIVVHLDISIPTSILNPVKIKYLQFASQSLNNSASLQNPLGTKTSTKIIPYYYNGTSYDYTYKNPFLIDKQSSSYLNLTPQSGIKLVGDFGVDRGFYISINENAIADYTLSGMQMSINYQFPFTKDTSSSNYLQYPNLGTVFSIQTRTKTIDFVMEALNTSPSLNSSNITSNSQRVRLYTKTNYNYSADIIDEDVYFYWNGEQVKEAIMTLNEWGILGVNFVEPLDFDSYSGKLIIKSSISVDNISFYSLSTDRIANSKTTRTWFNVLNPNLSNNTSNAQYTWATWSNSGLTWLEISKMADKSNLPIDISQIYDTYAGVAKTNASDNEGSSQLTIDINVGSILMDINKQSTIYSAR